MKIAFVLPRLFRSNGVSFFSRGLFAPSRCCHAASATRPGYSYDQKSLTSDRKSLEAFFPQLVHNIISKCDDDIQLKSFFSHYKEVLEYNVPFGKKIRGLTMMAAYKLLRETSGEVTEEDLHFANLMAWCIEMFQAFFLVADDIMDQSLTRRGRLCWYRKDGIGLSAFNDAILLQTGMFKLLHDSFGKKPYYRAVVDLFQEVYWKTNLGQSLDLLSSRRKDGMVDISTFTMDNYSAIVKNKTSYYTCYLPVALALHMNDISDENVLLQAKDILLKIGHLFQIQDDFIDCFGTSSETGKVGTDIAEGKCSWLAVVALQHANSEQVKMMVENYGQKAPESVQRVKDLYSTLKLPAIYADYEQKEYKKLVLDIKDPMCALPENLFQYCLRMIYKRRA